MTSLGGERHQVRSGTRAIFALLLAALPLVSAAQVTVTIDPAVRFQRLDGFGAAVVSALVHPEAPRSLSTKLRAAAVEAAFHQVGINLGSLGMLLESPGGFNRRQNDDGDPFHINWKGFDPTPLKTAKESIVDIAPPGSFTGYYLGAEAPNVRWASPWLSAMRNQDYKRFLDEAAEQVLATVTYWKNTYGEELPYYQFGNEEIGGNHALGGPDGSFGSVDPTRQIIDLVRTAGKRLRDAGFFKTRFIVGNEETENGSYELAAAILADPEARQYVGVIGYHVYPYMTGYSSDKFVLSTSGAGAPSGPHVSLRNRIRDLAKRYGVAVWQTENSHSGDPMSYDNFRARAIQIHDEFVYANASAYFCMYPIWDEATHRMHFGNSDAFMKEEGNALLVHNTTGRIDITGIGHAIGHYARWIKPGAVRVEAQSSNPLVLVTAFHDAASGRLSLVMINNSNNTLTAKVKIAGAKAEGKLAGEQSALAGYWASLPEAEADTPSGISVALPDGSVTSVAVKIGH